RARLRDGQASQQALLAPARAQAQAIGKLAEKNLEQAYDCPPPWRLSQRKRLVLGCWCFFLRAHRIPAGSALPLF
ncbi:MAG TPA: hypothetical protein VFZ81_00025, partial [Burkholderiales bacterium]